LRLLEAKKLISEVKKIEELIFNEIFSIALKKLAEMKAKTKIMKNNLPKDLLVWVRNRIEKL
jgi:hypothetical protein